MTVRPMNAKALGHVGFFIRGIQFRALGRVKTQKVAATELNPSRHVRGRRAFNAVLLHPNHPSALVSLARSRFRAPSDAASRSSAASRRPSRPGLLRPRSRRMPEAVRAPRGDQEKASAPRGNRSLALPDRLALLHERL